MALMTKDKYNSMSSEDRKNLEKLNEVEVLDIRIKSLNNLIKLMEAKILIFKV